MNDVRNYEKAEVAEGYEANHSNDEARLWDIAGWNMLELLRRDDETSPSEAGEKKIGS